MSVFGLLAIDPARSRHWLFPEMAEIIYGTLATIIVVSLLVKFASPTVKKFYADRTARIQKELDDSAADRTTAEAETTQVRQALGDIEAERARWLGDAEAQAAIMLSEGRERLQHEIAAMEARADADAETARGRGLDELRGEIVVLAAAAVDRIMAETLDDSTQQRLVEQFIAQVGAEAGATS
jgi:F-type H+-transporting ATPase subunit b